MSPKYAVAWTLAVLLTALPAAAQHDGLHAMPEALPPGPAEGDPALPEDPESRGVSDSRVAAGIRHWPGQIVRALLVLADEPALLRQLADDPKLLEDPEKISPAVDDRVKSAVRELRATPALVALAAAHPSEMAALRRLYAEAPEGMERRILELRGAYDRARAESAAAWQAALDQDPAALDQYRGLLTDFVRAQQKQYADFPYVHVTAREYYLAAVPNEAVVAFAHERRSELGGLWPLISRWWTDHRPEALDARALAPRPSVAAPVPEGAVALLPPEKRNGMWRAAGGDVPDSIGLMPVIMQPLADQPPEARYAYAVADHARLWTPEAASAQAESQPATPGSQEPPGAPAVVEAEPQGEEPPRDEPAGEETPIVAEREYVERVEYRPIYVPDPYAYYGVPIAYRYFYADVFPYYVGYPIWSPVYVGCFPYAYTRVVHHYYPGYAHYFARHGAFLSYAHHGSSFHLGVSIGGHHHGVGCGCGGCVSYVSRFYPGVVRHVSGRRTTVTRRVYGAPIAGIGDGRLYDDALRRYGDGRPANSTVRRSVASGAVAGGRETRSIQRAAPSRVATTGRPAAASVSGAAAAPEMRTPRTVTRQPAGGPGRPLSREPAAASPSRGASGGTAQRSIQRSPAAARADTGARPTPSAASPRSATARDITRIAPAAVPRSGAPASLRPGPSISPQRSAPGAAGGRPSPASGSRSIRRGAGASSPRASLAPRSTGPRTVSPAVGRVSPSGLGAARAASGASSIRGAAPARGGAFPSVARPVGAARGPTGFPSMRAAPPGASRSVARVGAAPRIGGGRPSVGAPSRSVSRRP